jgi:diguanylate cyclase
MNLTEHTLSEQMHITDLEISRRKELLRLGSEEAALLVNCKPFIEDEIETIVEKFYQVQTSDEEIYLLIGDADTLRRLHLVLRKYVVDLFLGCTDIDYVNNRLRIGLVHKQIGVEPKLYLSAVKTLKDILFETLERLITDTTVLGRTCQALDKQLYFDITLVFDTYTRSLISEVEIAKERVESYAASLEIQVAERTRQLEEKVSQLESALAMVKKLEGVIPICGICKKIRNDEESWQQLEQYISEHSEALFSHGLCPDCYEKEMMGIRALREAKLVQDRNGTH